VRYHIQTLSTGGGVEALRRARQDLFGQVHLSAEVTPHHLLLSEDRCASYDTLAKTCPPLRSLRDQRELLAGIAEGVITVLASDHEPHTREEKDLEFAVAPSGVIGLESAFGMYAKALIETDTIDWPRLIDMASTQPAKLLGLHEHRGTLQVGACADVTIIDPKHHWTIDAGRFHSLSRNCPFHGWSAPARAVATIVGGELKFLVDRERVVHGSAEAALMED
jgi:dihydroorotase